MATRNLINAELVSVSFGLDPVLDGVSLGVSEGARIGIVGRNGGGKSTLLAVLAGTQPPDTGRVSHAAGINVGSLAQLSELNPDDSVRTYLLADTPAHIWASQRTTRVVLTELLGGFDAARLDRRLGSLSGGERRRTELARLLLSDLDVLILDEPTNHLAVEAVAWLADYLTSVPRLALVVVTHDRWFLDAVTDRTWEVGRGEVAEYQGGYSAYVLAKAERSRQTDAAEARRRNLLRKELAWLRRGPPARTSKPQFRIDAANALIEAEPPPRDGVELLKFAGARLGRTVLECDDISFVRGERTLLDHVTWRLGPGDRVGIVGVNGAGKTTLARLLTGELAPTAGSITTGVTVRLAILSQHLDEINPEWRVLEAVEDVARYIQLANGQDLSASQLCERLGFGTQRQWTPVGELSGGERRRLQLTRLLMGEPNVLILDEPTNDFDVETLAALEDLLDSFAGTLVVISHDRYFLERVCDKMVGLLGDGDLRDLPGGIEEYLDLRRSQLAVVESEDSEPPDAPPGLTSAEIRAHRKELARLERTIARTEVTEARLHAELLAHAHDHTQLADLNRALHACVAERADAEEQWLELAASLED